MRKSSDKDNKIDDAERLREKNTRLYDFLANMRMYKFFYMMSIFVLLGFALFWCIDYFGFLPMTKFKIVYIYVDSLPTDAQTLNDIFDHHYTHMLATMGILLSLFGLGLPTVSYFYQRVSLRDEREAILKEIDLSLNSLKKRIKKTEIDQNTEFDTIKENICSSFETANNNIKSTRETLSKSIQQSREDLKTMQESTQNQLHELQKEKSALENEIRNHQDKIQEMTGTLADLIEKHKTKMQEHDNEISKTQSNNDFTFGYFAQQFGNLCVNDKISDATSYFIIAAKYFSKMRKARAIICLKDALRCINKIGSKSLSNNTFEFHGENFQVIKDNMSSDEDAMKLLDDLKKEIERVKKDTVKAPEGNKE